MTSPAELLQIVHAAIQEDVGTGDLSSAFFIPENSTSTANLVAREACHLAGMNAALCVFQQMNPPVIAKPQAKDGDRLQPGDVALSLAGSTRSILTAERTALNFLQQLSGVATLTAQFVQEIAGTSAQILDTRKTVPGLRSLQKAAVLAGGGTNHRFGLFDMVMIKDNHLTASGSSAELAGKIKAFRQSHPTIRVEIEADTVAQALEFFRIPGVDVVLLDNMSLEDLRESVAARPQHIVLEASGGIRLENAAAIARTGVDFLSVGALTHSARAIDFGLDFA